MTIGFGRIGARTVIVAIVATAPSITAIAAPNFELDIPYESPADALPASPATTVSNLADMQQNYVSAKFIQLHKDLDSYGSLESGWNGPGSASPFPWSIFGARELVRGMPESLSDPTAMISSKGIVGLYWDEESIHMDVEVDRDGCFSLFARNKTTGKERFEESIQLSRVDVISEVMADIAG